MSAPTIVQVSDVSKRFTVHRHKSLKERLVDSAAEKRHREDFWALRDITLDVEAGSTVGLVGHNGSGKSTLLKVIGGIIEPSNGSVRRRGRMAALLELGAGFHPDLTGRENVYLNAAILGLTQKEIDRHFDSMVDFSGIEPFIDTQVKFFSSGMYVRLAFAVAVHVDPDLLLVDEVLAVGDEPFQNKCMARISEFQQEGRTILVVSHSAGQIQALCDRVIVLNHGEMMFDGGAVEGIEVLQGGYRDDERAAAEDAITRGAVTLGELRLGEAEDGSAAIRAGDDLPVSLRLDVEPDAPPYSVRFTVESARSGIVVYELDASRLVDFPTRRGSHSLQLRFEGFGLGAGEYVLRTVAIDAASNAICPALSAPFTVDDDAAGVGLVRVHPLASFS